MKNPKLTAVFNLLGFLLVLVMNTLANTLPINGFNTGELSARYPNLFVPAGFTFGIWGIIYLLLLAFLIYQWAGRRSGSMELVKQIGPWFLVSCLANASWILAWHYLFTVLSLLIMVVLLLSLIQIYRRLNIGRPVSPKAGKWLAHIPFSVYLGWITVATIANATTVLVNAGWNGWGISEVTWTVLMISIAILIGLIFLWERSDIFYALVLCWAFYGIYANRSAGDPIHQPILTVLVLGFILLGLGIIFRLSRWLRL